MKKKVVPKLRQEVKVDIVTRDDIKIYYTGKFQDFTARYVIKSNFLQLKKSVLLGSMLKCETYEPMARASLDQFFLLLLLLLAIYFRDLAKDL